MAAQNSANGSLPSLPVIEDGVDVFNRIMREIEPELTTREYPLLAEKYANESEENRTLRMERYRLALLEYAKRYAAYRDAKEKEVRSFGKNLKHAFESGHRLEEESQIAGLESAISDQ